MSVIHDRGYILIMMLLCVHIRHKYYIDACNLIIIYDHDGYTCAYIVYARSRRSEDRFSTDSNQIRYTGEIIRWRLYIFHSLYGSRRRRRRRRYRNNSKNDDNDKETIHGRIFRRQLYKP